MKILITGGAGFIGSNLADALIKKKHRVVVLDDLSSGKNNNINRSAKFYKADVKNRKAVEDIFRKEKPEIVFHLAAQINVRRSTLDPVFDAHTNILGGLNVIESAVKNRIKKFIFSSTGGVLYGDTSNIPTPESHPAFPVCPYGVAKLATEKYLHYHNHVFKLNYTILRYSNVYGPRQNPHGEAGVVAIFINKMMTGLNPVINGNGKQTRDYVFVSDIVNANLLALNSLKCGAYNIGTGKESDVNKIFSEINRHFGNQFKAVYAPAKQGEQSRSCLDFRLAKKHLGWQPKINLSDGIKKTVLWFRE